MAKRVYSWVMEWHFSKERFDPSMEVDQALKVICDIMEKVGVKINRDAGAKPDDMEISMVWQEDDSHERKFVLSFSDGVFPSQGNIETQHGYLPLVILLALSKRLSKKTRLHLSNSNGDLIENPPKECLEKPFIRDLAARLGLVLRPLSEITINCENSYF